MIDIIDKHHRRTFGTSVGHQFYRIEYAHGTDYRDDRNHQYGRHEKRQLDFPKKRKTLRPVDTRGFDNVFGHIEYRAR